MSFSFGHGDQSGEAQSPAGASKSQETLGEVWSMVTAKVAQKGKRSPFGPTLPRKSQEEET